ncbi:hypothetical protein [Acetobacter sp. LMG 32666]|uniref:hypothetical protein n=1 Tax=Acetobacter sp. LMG 32666 TaxID=2959295 RepID=UPI0030C847D2
MNSPAGYFPVALIKHDGILRGMISDRFTSDSLTTRVTAVQGGVAFRLDLLLRLISP